VNVVVPVVPEFESVYCSLKLAIVIQETGLILYTGSSNLVCPCFIERLSRINLLHLQVLFYIYVHFSGRANGIGEEKRRISLCQL
jgi:hypothetical protein